MTVADLGRRMDADELGWWIAFYSFEQDAGQITELTSLVERDLVRARQE